MQAFGVKLVKVPTLSPAKMSQRLADHGRLADQAELKRQDSLLDDCNCEIRRLRDEVYCLKDELRRALSQLRTAKLLTQEDYEKTLCDRGIDDNDD